MSKSGAHCHKLVKETAIEMAHECYAALMHRNDWYWDWQAAHPNMGPKALERFWVNQKWGEFVEGARATLAGMLASPIDEELKIQIYDALCLDQSLIRGRVDKQIILG